MNEKNINHPTYYNVGKYEVIDVIYGWGLDFDLGNALKYIARAGHKTSGSLDLAAKTKQDLNKALWYLAHERKMLVEENLSYSISERTGIYYIPDQVVEDWQLGDLLGEAVKQIYWAAQGNNTAVQEGHLMVAWSKVAQHLEEIC